MNETIPELQPISSERLAALLAETTPPIAEVLSEHPEIRKKMQVRPIIAPGYRIAAGKDTCKQCAYSTRWDDDLWCQKNDHQVRPSANCFIWRRKK